MTDEWLRLEGLTPRESMLAHQVTDAGTADAFRRVLRHWADDGHDQVLSIRPGMVTGFRLVADTQLRSHR